MKLVVDASVVAALIFPDERPESVIHIGQRMSRTETIAPKLFWYEIRATCLKKERRGVLDAIRSNEALRRIGALPIVLNDTTDVGATIDLARRHGLTFYDAAYLGLAIEQGSQLATLDRRLADAARSEGVLLET